MKSRGFSYATPWDAYSDPRWISVSASTEHSPDEIATAQADMSCKDSTNLVGMAVAVESAYDTRYINSRHDDLMKIRKNLELRVDNANALISAAGNA